MTGKTYIEFLNDNFEIGFRNLPHPKENCPTHIASDATIGGFKRVLINNQDQYIAPTGMTLQKMFKTWLKQAPVKK